MNHRVVEADGLVDCRSWHVGPLMTTWVLLGPVSRN